MAVSVIHPVQLQELLNAGHSVEVIDVRTPAEFQELRMPFARNVPLDQLTAGQIAATRRGSHVPLYFICRSGSRGKQACERLLAAGLTDIFNVDGGTLAWEQAGLPVVRGTKTMSLERQVRIAAGALVLIGALLAYFSHPVWIGLPAFIGAGLIVAGLTDTCGMGMLLSKMPWNQVHPTAAQHQSECSTDLRPTGCT
jgi:rhodanese-related sulfurtransferase